MFNSLKLPHAARLLIGLPLAAAIASCGNDTGALVTVPNSVVVADFNGDGALDVAVASAEIDETGITTQNGFVSLILQDKASPGTFLPAVNYTSSPRPPSGLAVGDLTGTGSQDLVVANNAAGTLSVLLQTGRNSGQFGAAQTITLPAGSQPNDVQIADLNGDGLPDLVEADGNGQVIYMLQDAANPGTFLAPVSLPVPTRGIAVAVGDLNGDGLPDLAVTSMDDLGDNGTLTIYFQDPAHPGTFLPNPTSIAALGEPSQVRIADVNQDNLPDIIIACQGESYDGTGTPGAMVMLQVAGAPGTFGPEVMYPTASDPTATIAYGVVSVAIGDLNGDGLPDIAMTGEYPEGEGTTYVLQQDASNPGTFLISGDYPGLGQPDSIVIGDMNGDGLPDLVTADATTAAVLFNKSTAPGTFQAALQIGY